MTLLFVRHGETALNAARVLQPAATPLGATGLAQAQAIALRVAALAPAAVVTSDMPRALQTAQAIAQAAGATPPHAATLVNCTLHLQGAAAEDATTLSGG